MTRRMIGRQRIPTPVFDRDASTSGGLFKADFDFRGFIRFKIAQTPIEYKPDTRLPGPHSADLENLAKNEPQNVKVLRLLVRAYRGLGREQDAKRAEEKAETIEK